MLKCYREYPCTEGTNHFQMSKLSLIISTASSEIRIAITAKFIINIGISCANHSRHYFPNIWQLSALSNQALGNGMYLQTHIWFALGDITVPHADVSLQCHLRPNINIYMGICMFARISATSIFNKGTSDLGICLTFSICQSAFTLSTNTS